METTPIIKNILLPKLKKDSKYSDEKVGASFWKNFSTVLVRFEENAQPLYNAIFSLELGNPEQIIDKLPKIYAQFLKELAECYVLGQTSEATDYLVKTNNKTFLKEVQFLKTMQQAIKSVERKRIKTELPQSYARLTFELSETEIANAIKKKAREELKKKMKLWDAELEDVVPVISMANLEDDRMQSCASVTSPEKKQKVDAVNLISTKWVRYASIAAVFIIGFMIWQPTKLSNEEIFVQYNTVEPLNINKIVLSSESVEVRGGEVMLQNYSKSETDEAMEAIALFKNGNYENSKRILQALNPKAKNNQLLLFLAIAQLKTNEVNQAVSSLEYLNAISNFEYIDDVKFYLALGYINKNEKQKAKVLLVNITSLNNKYSKNSKEILDKLRWF